MTDASTSTDVSNFRVAILTAYTTDYDIGYTCATVNRAYAKRHGYSFVCREHPPVCADDLRHPSWNKVSLVIECLRAILNADDQSPVPLDTTHLLWIDADAVVINHDKRFEELWADLPANIELLIGEDVTLASLINAGVFSIRVSPWSLALWEDVWSVSLGKYAWKGYFEQTCLVKQLEARGEGLEAMCTTSTTRRGESPFHSWCGGPSGPKLFPHVCVLPRRCLNTNRCDIRDAATRERGPPHRAEDACDFIFHAAGHPILRRVGTNGERTAELWTPPKGIGLRAVIYYVAGLGEPLTEEEMERAPPTVDARALKPPPPKRVRWPGRIAN